MPSTREIEVVLRNPTKLEDKISYFIEYEPTDFNLRWIKELKKNLQQRFHLEKNYCWIGWAQSPRDVDYLCREINRAIWQINEFNASGIWQDKGLSSYNIDDHFTKDVVMYDDKEYPIGKWVDNPNNLGLCLKHDSMNRLHRYFEDLQGEAWSISPYYQLADYETKWAIRQLNVLCHELEGWVSANRKVKLEPQWQRPSQITTFLNAPRSDLRNEDYDLFIENKFDRVFGGVYLHWAQVGKTQFEVFRDEEGQDVDEQTCSAMNSLKFYSGEFDIEWARDVTEETAPWHKKEQDEFRDWLKRNNMNPDDPKMSLGYIKLGQVNLQKSFNTTDFFEIVDIVGNHLDIYQIKVDDVTGTFDYVWSDSNYKQMQIDFLKPGYDWSKEQYGK